MKNVERNYISNWYKWSDIYWSDEEEEHDDNSANKKHKNVISFDDLHKAPTTSEEDSDKERDASCSNSSTKNDFVYLSRDKDGDPTDERLRTTIPSGKEDKSKLEDCRNDVQSTEEGKSVEDNVNDKNIKQNKISSSKVHTCSLDQWESDDPRKGGKICLRKLINGNALGVDTTYEERSISKKRILDDTSHMQMEESNSTKDAEF